MNIKTKTVEIDGVKYLEKSFKKVVPVSDYGITVVKGSELQKEANLTIGFVIDTEKEYTILKGYLNNKLVPGSDIPAKDSYGDIPTGDKVYDIGRLINNPVALYDHDNSAENIVGNYIYLSEDAQGLKFKLVLRPLDEVFSDDMKDVISTWGKGWGKAFSIGGRWLYDMEKSNPDNNEYILVKAILHEASLVGIGADQWALSVAPESGHVAEQGKNASCGTLEYAVAKFLEAEDDSELVKMLKI